MVHKLSVAAQSVGPTAYTGERGRRRTGRRNDVSNTTHTLNAFDAPTAGGEPRRWSSRRTAAFLFVVNCASWVGIAAVVKAAL